MALNASYLRLAKRLFDAGVTLGLPIAKYEGDVSTIEMR